MEDQGIEKASDQNEPTQVNESPPPDDIKTKETKPMANDAIYWKIRRRSAEK